MELITSLTSNKMITLLIIAVLFIILIAISFFSVLLLKKRNISLSSSEDITEDTKNVDSEISLQKELNDMTDNPDKINNKSHFQPSLLKDSIPKTNNLNKSPFVSNANENPKQINEPQVPTPLSLSASQPSFNQSDDFLDILQPVNVPTNSQNPSIPQTQSKPEFAEDFDFSQFDNDIPSSNNSQVEIQEKHEPTADELFAAAKESPLDNISKPNKLPEWFNHNKDINMDSISEAYRSGNIKNFDIVSNEHSTIKSDIVRNLPEQEGN